MTVKRFKVEVMYRVSRTIEVDATSPEDAYKSAELALGMRGEAFSSYEKGTSTRLWEALGGKFEDRPVIEDIHITTPYPSLKLTLPGLLAHIKLALNNALENNYQELLTWKPEDVYKDLCQLDAIVEENAEFVRERDDLPAVLKVITEWQKSQNN